MSGAVHDSLAEGYLRDPKNDAAKQMLEVLR